MTKSHYSVIDLMQSAATLVDDAVTNIRNRGFTREQALAKAADELGLPVGRAKKLAYGEIVKIAVAEYRVLEARFDAHLEAEELHTMTRLQSIRERRLQLSIEA